MLLSPAVQSNAGMANRQGDVDLRFAQVSAPSYHFGLERAGARMSLQVALT